ncbi:MAG: ABC transporter ATP-binding protein [Clostridia bacterium]|nr:ABC transporter ATP-binding protein [Clostridia bacterium]
MSILKVKNLSVGYRNLNVLKDISFKVDYGDYFCIVGSNGSGKSTLVKCLLGLIPHNHKGKIEFDVSTQEIAYLPQINTIPREMPATVKEVIMTGLQKSGKRLPFYTKKDAKAYKSTVKMLDIEKLAKKKIGELSGGQLQRVLLARALCRKPKLLILDEPTSGLDEKSTGNLYSLLDKLNQEEKMTIIMITHDLDDVKFCANKVLVLDNEGIFCGNISDWLKIRREGHCHHDH